jgi:hypothetical protein
MKPSWFNDDTGWDDRDIEANELGQKFGNAWRKHFQDKYTTTNQTTTSKNTENTND